MNLTQLSLLTFENENGNKKDLCWIALSQLLPHPRNPRRGQPDKLEAIAQSMREEGYRMEKPMLVRPFDGSYQIIGGHTRYQAAKMAGLEKVLCVVEEMDDDTAILRIAQDNLNDPFSWFSQCIYVAQNSVKGSKKGLSRSVLIRACTGKEGDAAELEGRRKGDVGEFLLWLEEQTVHVDGLLNPEVNLTRHLYVIQKSPQQYWQQLTELLIENEWSVKQTEAIVTAIKDVHIPEHFHFWLNPDKAIKETIAEALTGEIRTPRDIKNWVEAAQKQMDELPESRKVTIVQDDKEEIQYLDLRAEFLNRLPELCKGSKKPSAKGINAIAAELLKRATQLDEEHKKWVESRANADFLAAQAEKERLRILELTEQFTPIGFNSPLQELEQLQGEWLNSFDAIITDVPYLLSNDGTTVRSGKEASVNKGFADRRGEAIEPSQYMSLFFNALKPGGYFVTTCTIHVLMDLMAEGDKAGFVLRQKLIWYKRNSPPLFTADRFQPDYEDVLVFVKPGETPYFGYEEVKDGDRQRGATIDIPQCAGKERTEHTTQKPESLYELLIKAYTQQGDRVLEPFAGSGTTPAVCKRLGRRCIWVEQEQKFFNIASDRIESTPYFWEV